MQTNLTTPTFGDDRLPPRFWAKIRVLEDGCWEWMGSRIKGGYGHFGVGSRTDGSRKLVLAHRLCYETLIGPIPDGLESDHLCRNRACVNPTHIEPVTRSENLRRSPLLKGRGHSSKLHREDVMAIRASILGSRPLARQYGVSRSLIQFIKHRKVWRHLD